MCTLQTHTSYYQIKMGLQHRTQEVLRCAVSLYLMSEETVGTNNSDTDNYLIYLTKDLIHFQSFYSLLV
jgi:hypothetical protein